METRAKRTLVKSAPELWELADDLARMESWMAGVVGAHESVAIEVTRRQPQRILAWRTASGGSFGRMALELEEKGFGTSVVITAQSLGLGPPDGALEKVLDELGSPERRPFARA